MNKLASAVVAAALVALSLPVAGMDTKMNMKMMDSNNDGMVSKDEFMKYHETMYDGMKKNSSGMVSMKDMQMMMSGGHMSGGSSNMAATKGMKGHDMMKDGTMMKDKSK